MNSRLLIDGIIFGFLIAVPVGPIGLLCINRALSGGTLYGLLSGLGVATADAIAGGIAALGLTLVYSFLVGQQAWLHIVIGLFLCYLGFRTFVTRPAAEAAAATANGLLGAYTSTFLLTVSNPVTIISFFAIYAGWGVESLRGEYFSAAILMLGVFVGSALWWVILGVGLLFYREHFTEQVLGWVHKVSGAVIAGFGFVILWRG
jgi:threonine/homoserine/homoserine lactone efflux protein